MPFFAGLRYAARNLARTPGFTLAAILILALGIGANAAIFGVVNAVILSRLPFHDPERLVFVWETYPNMPDPPGGRIQPCRRNFSEWKRQNTVFSTMAAFLDRTLVETGIAPPVRLSVAFASVDLFPALGVDAAVGRTFIRDEEQPGRDRVAVLTDAYFESRFGRDPACLGKAIVLDGVAHTVVGVLPRRFRLPAYGAGSEQKKPALFVPLSRAWSGKPGEDGRRELLVIARLRPGALHQARVEMTGIAARLSASDPALNEGWKTSVLSAPADDSSPEVNRALYLLTAAVAFVLLIACANLANLMLARASRRQRDFGIRLALGAGRRHIVSPLLTEALLLALSGAALGLVLAGWALKAMLALGLDEIPRPEAIRIDATVFAFAAACAVLTALLFGLVPALAVSRPGVLSALKAGAGAGIPSTHRRQRNVLVAVEVALALMLLSGAALLIRSFYTLATADLGFQPAGILAFDIDLGEKAYPEEPARTRFNRRLHERLQSLPGVVSVAITDGLPYHRISITDLEIVGRPQPKPGEAPLVDFADVSPSYFSTMGIALKAGRLFTDADVSRPVVIINEAIARRFWAGSSPIGHSILAGSSPRKPFEIVGVVVDHHQFGADTPVRLQVFYPWLGMNNPIALLRTHSDPLSLASAVTREVFGIDKELAVYHVKSMRQIVDAFLAQRRFITFLMGAFAAIALVLAATGIYGVLSNVVSSSTHEIGIRMALGASAGDVLALVFRRSLVPIAAGAAAGLIAVLALGRFIESLLFSIRARDPLTIGAVTVLVLAVACAATWLPARRAARLDPTAALREE